MHMQHVTCGGGGRIPTGWGCHVPTRILPRPVHLPEMHLTIEERWRWWRSIGAPRYVCAPMVLQSELSFRMLVRAHGTTLCYSPMVPVSAFLASAADGVAEHPLTGGPNTQASWFTTDATDRPLIAQLGGNDAEELCAVGQMLQSHVDAIDINFGCPQRCAEQGGYGAFLMEDAPRVQHIIETLVARLAVPITAKIRIWSDLDRTIDFARMLEAAGVAAVCVHGRRREQRHHEGPADWDTIRAIKQALRIPVISNGSVRRRAEAEACLEYTGCDSVMSATALLANPFLFAPSPPPPRLPHPVAAAVAAASCATASPLPSVDFVRRGSTFYMSSAIQTARSTGWSQTTC